MFVINWGLVVEGVVLLSPFAVAELNSLSHTKFVAKSQALSTIIQGASLLVSDMEKNLAGVEPGSGTAADVISATVASLKALYPEAVAKLGLSPDETTALLHMILQKVQTPTEKDTVSQYTGAVTAAPVPARIAALLRHAELTGITFPSRIL